MKGILAHKKKKRNKQGTNLGAKYLTAVAVAVSVGQLTQARVTVATDVMVWRTVEVEVTVDTEVRVVVDTDVTVWVWV